MLVLNKSIKFSLNCYFLLKYKSSIHNNYFSYENVISLNQERNVHVNHRLQAKTIQNCSKQLCGCILMREENFFNGQSVIMDLNMFVHKCQNTLMMDVLTKNTQPFTSQDVNWLTGVLWIIVMFLSAVWTLIMMEPMYAKCIHFCSDEETNLPTTWTAWGWAHFHF